jgi:hypothetical protein
MRRFILILFSLFFFTAPSASAQLGGSGFEVSINPETPAPFEEVVLSLDSFVFNIDQATIVWRVDGKEELRGIGERILRLRAKDTGLATAVDIIVSFRGATAAKRAVIVPAGVDLLVEATDVYTPPFYRGRSLPTTESEIKIVAVPDVRVNNRKVTPNQLSYEWVRAGNTEVSGFGLKKSFFIFRNSMLNKREDISVGVRGQSTELGRGGMALEMVQPKIVFYEESDGNVLYQRALLDLRLNKETTIVAAPYFFSPKNIADSALEFVWKINNNEVAAPGKNRLNIRPTDTGIARIDLEVTHADKLLLSGAGSLPITIIR